MNDDDRGDGYYSPHIALVCVQVLFGSLPVIGKIVLAELPPVALVGMRVAITALVLFAVQRWRNRLWLKDRGDYARLAVLSLFGVVFNQLLFIGGLSLTTASNTSLLSITIPIFTVVAGALIGTERIRKLTIAGIALAAAGVVFLIDPRNASFSSATTIGDLMIIANSISYAIYLATSKDVITRNGAFRSIMWVSIFAGVICVPLGAFSLTQADAAGVSISVWLLVIYIGIAATALPYILNAWALARVPPSTVAVFIYLQPMIGFLLAAYFLGEAITFRVITAAALIFAGLYLTTRKTRANAVHMTS